MANIVLKETKGSDAGWTGIALAWGIAVFIGVFISADGSGAHLNPAVTVGLATASKLEWGLVPGYVVAQVLGAMFGNLLVWLTYKKQYDATEDEGAILATFSTSPAVRSPFWNFMTEFIGTFVLVFVIFYIAGPSINLGIEGNTGAVIGLGSVGAIPVAFLVWVIGLSLGGTTGYAINPARDLGPRIMHAILPVKGKSDWGYAWIPVVGPIIGALIASFLYMAIK